MHARITLTHEDFSKLVRGEEVEVKGLKHPLQVKIMLDDIGFAGMAEAIQELCNHPFGMELWEGETCYTCGKQGESA